MFAVVGRLVHINFFHTVFYKVLLHTKCDSLCTTVCCSPLSAHCRRDAKAAGWGGRGHGGSGDPPGSGESGPQKGSACAISGWCKDSGPYEGDVKASLPFHGALIWPFHWVKPKEIHVHDLCGASLHSGTGRKKKKARKQLIGNEKGRPVCTQDTRPLNSNL